MGNQPIRPRRQTLLNAHATLRRQSLTPTQLRSKIRALAREHEEVRQVKKTHADAHLPTNIALQMSREANYRKKVLLRMNREAKHAGLSGSYTEMDAERIIDLQESIQAMIQDTPALRKIKPAYSIGTAIHDYVKARIALERFNIPPTFIPLATAMLAPHFVGHERAMRKAIETEPSQMDMFSPLVKRMNAFEPFEFFQRIQGDQKQLRRIANQQLVLESELESALLEASKAHEDITRADREIHQPSEQTLQAVRARVKGFDSRPRTIKERIIQEHVATILGKKLAEEIASMAGLRGRLSRRRRPLFEWIEQSLQNKENVRFLARKALEWYRTRRA